MKKGTLLALALGLGLGAVALFANSNKTTTTTSPSKPMVVVPSNPQTPVTVSIPGKEGTITVSQNDPSFDGIISYLKDPLPYPFYK